MDYFKVVSLFDKNLAEDIRIGLAEVEQIMPNKMNPNIEMFCVYLGMYPGCEYRFWRYSGCQWHTDI